jgi:hypothetical protein
MDVKSKFLQVLDGVDFRYGNDVDSPDQLVKLGDHVLAQFEALGEERQKRGEDLMCMILADALQPRALARYGDAGIDSVRMVLVEELHLDADTIWGKYQRLAKQGIGNLGLNEFQLEQLNNYIDLMPDIVSELIAELASRFDLIPRKNAPTLALVLRDLFQEEADNAELSRDN